MPGKKLGALFLLLFLTACFSSQPKLKEQEIKKVVDAMFAFTPLCLQADLAWDGVNKGADNILGSALIRVEYKNLTGREVNKTVLRQMNILVKQGLYQDFGTETVRLQPQVVIFNRLYRLTPVGEKFFTGGDRQICLGHYRFHKLKYYTPPANNSGRQISYVTYSVKAQTEPWQRDFFALADSKAAAIAASGREMTSVFYLTNKGWKILQGNTRCQ